MEPLDAADDEVHDGWVAALCDSIDDTHWSAGPLDYVGHQHKKNAAGATVTCAVTIGPRDAGGFGIAVKMDVTDKSLPQAELEALVKETHEKVCPYSHATRGNIDVAISVHGA